MCNLLKSPSTLPKTWNFYWRCIIMQFLKICLRAHVRSRKKERVRKHSWGAAVALKPLLHSSLVWVLGVHAHAPGVFIKAGVSGTGTSLLTTWNPAALHSQAHGLACHVFKRLSWGFSLSHITLPLNLPLFPFTDITLVLINQSMSHPSQP